MVANYLVDNNLIDNIEHTSRLDGFKIKIDFNKVPGEIGEALRKATRESVTIFKGSKIRVRILSSSLLQQSLVDKLQNMLENWDDWVEKFLDAKADFFTEYANDFYKFTSEKSTDPFYTAQAQSDSFAGMLQHHYQA